MSSSVLYVMDDGYWGYIEEEFRNSWLFTPMAMKVLEDKYVHSRGPRTDKFGLKLSIMNDLSGDFFRYVNDKLNNSTDLTDRIVWEMANQQIFFSKDKEIIAQALTDFVVNNKEFDKDDEGIAVFDDSHDHLIARFHEVSNAIKSIDEERYPYFIFKNTTVDDGVERWFEKFDDYDEEYVEAPFSEFDKLVADFIHIEDGTIRFEDNISYFKNKADES